MDIATMLTTIIAVCAMASLLTILFNILLGPVKRDIVKLEQGQVKLEQGQIKLGQSIKEILTFLKEHYKKN